MRIRWVRGMMKCCMRRRRRSSLLTHTMQVAFLSSSLFPSSGKTSLMQITPIVGDSTSTFPFLLTSVTRTGAALAGVAAGTLVLVTVTSNITLSVSVYENQREYGVEYVSEL